MRNTQAVVDLGDDLVYCADCDKPIKNVSPFAKGQLKSMKQVKKAKKNVYSVKCGSCQSDGLPKLVDGKLCCVKCNQPITNIPKFFEAIIKDAVIEKEKEDKEG